ncbi:MAG: hypothetical protein Q8O30_02760 [Candidatus Omnitrophota bacterium]|nr:hypothetical protein [Candidatus Omnitrophota bacterium]
MVTTYFPPEADSPQAENPKSDGSTTLTIGTERSRSAEYRPSEILGTTLSISEGSKPETPACRQAGIRISNFQMTKTINICFERLDFINLNIASNFGFRASKFSLLSVTKTVASYTASKLQARLPASAY